MHLSVGRIFEEHRPVWGVARLRVPGAWDMKTLISAILLVFIVVAPASAEQTVFRMNGWEGSRYDEGGSYTHCAAEAYRVSASSILALAIRRDILALSIRRDGSLGILASSPQWMLRPGETMDAEVLIDGKRVADHVEAIDYTAVRVLFTTPGEIKAAGHAIANGEIIEIRTRAGRFAFKLKTPNEVLEALAQSNDTAITAEFDAPERAGALRRSKAERVDQAEAMTYVVNLLSAAGMSGQVYLQPSEYRDILPEQDVVWRNPDGTIGTAALYVNARRGDLDLASGNILSGEAAFCDGNFTSGVKRKEEAENALLKEMFTTCDMDSKVRETYYVIHATRQGLLMAIGTIALTTGQREVVEDTGKAIARGAQMSF